MLGGRNRSELSPQGREVLLLAEELAAAPAVVPPLCEGEPHRAARAAVPAFVLHPVVGSTAAWLVTHGPAEHTASAVPNQDPAVVPAGDTARGPAQKQPPHSPAGHGLLRVLVRLVSVGVRAGWGHG